MYVTLKNADQAITQQSHLDAVSYFWNISLSSYVGRGTRIFQMLQRF